MWQKSIDYINGLLLIVHGKVLNCAEISKKHVKHILYYTRHKAASKNGIPLSYHRKRSCFTLCRCVTSHSTFPHLFKSSQQDPAGSWLQTRWWCWDCKLLTYCVMWENRLNAEILCSSGSSALCVDMVVALLFLFLCAVEPLPTYGDPANEWPTV